MTIRLYLDDPALASFDAIVTACVRSADGWRISLDRSAFYPTSGGQGHDLGSLWCDETVLEVRDVTADEAEVWHQVGTPLVVGSRVHGVIDAARRHDHRQQHSGQHILSASFDTAGARTESVHLGSEVCTLDLHREVSPDECRGAEDDANRVVWEDRPVTIRYADAGDLASEPRLRKATGRTGRIRLIDIDGHDLSACGGTHVHRTGEVGCIVIRAIERLRGGTRVTFVCGRRALESYRVLRAGVDAASRLLSVGPEHIADAVARLRDDLKAEQRSRRTLGERLAAQEVAGLASQFTRAGAAQVLVAHLADADAQALRAAASRLTSEPGRLVALLGGEMPHALVVARSADLAHVDASVIVEAIRAAHGGKGGGRADLAQAAGVAVTLDQLRAMVAGRA